MTSGARRHAAVLAILEVAVATIGALVVLVTGAAHFAAIPHDDVNALRMTPVVALARGYSMYATHAGGPVAEYLYPPLSAFLLMPAALAGSPSGILLIGACLNLAWFLGPVAWLHARVAGRRHALAALGMVAFILVALGHVGLTYILFNIHVEAPAAGWSALAIGAVLVGAGQRPAIVVSAAAAVVAVWTKQTAVPLFVALPAYLWLSAGARAAGRWLVWAFVLGVAVSVVLVGAFGWRELWFTMWTVPSGHPFYGEAEGGKLAGLLGSWRVLVLGSRQTAMALVAVAVLTRCQAASWRDWLSGNRWVGLALLSACMLPTSLLGGAKYLGFLSAHSPTAWALVAAVTVGCVEGGARAGWAGRLLRGGLVLYVLVGVLLLGGAAWRSAPATLAHLGRWRDNPHEQALRYARLHAGEVYFPRHPLATLLADGRLDHSDLGLYDWELAGQWVTPEHFRNHLPPHPTIVAYRAPEGGISWIRDPTIHLPAFRRRIDEPALPGWIVVTRE